MAGSPPASAFADAPHPRLSPRSHQSVPSSRAYGEAERRGLVTGEVGRGKLVRPLAEPVDASRQFVFDRRGRGDTMVDAAANTLPGSGRDATARSRLPIDLSFNLPFDAGQPKLLRSALARLSKGRYLHGLLAYQPECGDIRHRRAESVWITPPPASMLPPSASSSVTARNTGLSLAFATIAKAGDLIVTEQLTYPTVKTIAGQSGLGSPACRWMRTD